MGASCFKSHDEPVDVAGGEEGQLIQASSSRISRLPKSVRTNYSSHKQLEPGDGAIMINQQKKPGDEWDVVAALDGIIDRKVGASRRVAAGRGSLEDYEVMRKELKERERALGFEHKLASAATAKEKRVNEILQALKRDDKENVYAKEDSRIGWGGQKHPRFAGDHFLANKDLIDESKVFRIARMMPKGAHLHIHFNACLHPQVLLGIASMMEQMFITSDLPLSPVNDYHNYKRAKIQFSIMTHPASTANLFDTSCEDRKGAMKFKEFIAEFPRRYRPDENKDALAWLQEKLMFREEEAHNAKQTVAGAWQEFNTRTQMMKGLFNYETAYRTYTRKCLEDFMADNIQYAEIRPNFMDTNQVWKDDGTEKIDNEGIMRMIIEEYERFQEMAKEEGGRKFGGLKIIYCCPRSWPNDKVKKGLEECLAFKKRWPEWIAGFDLVGEEGQGKPLRAFVPEFLQFQQDCHAAGVEISFLLHCGETLECGSETDDNLLDALLLKAKRIGHGFALARHPYVMERMKQAGVCLEVCPISNEALGLTPRASGHAMYSLLANNVHCTVNSDNGTLFK